MDSLPPGHPDMQGARDYCHHCMNAMAAAGCTPCRLHSSASASVSQAAAALPPSGPPCSTTSSLWMPPAMNRALMPAAAALQHAQGRVGALSMQRAGVHQARVSHPAAPTGACDFPVATGLAARASTAMRLRGGCEACAYTGRTPPRPWRTLPHHAPKSRRLLATARPAGTRPHAAAVAPQGVGGSHPLPPPPHHRARVTRGLQAAAASNAGASPLGQQSPGELCWWRLRRSGVRACP